MEKRSGGYLGRYSPWATSDFNGGRYEPERFVIRTDHTELSFNLPNYFKMAD
jgi:hypothetical protein